MTKNSDETILKKIWYRKELLENNSQIVWQYININLKIDLK